MDEDLFFKISVVSVASVVSSTATSSRTATLRRSSKEDIRGIMYLEKEATNRVEYSIDSVCLMRIAISSFTLVQRSHQILSYPHTS